MEAANDTNTEADRRAIQEEVDQLTQEIDRISSTTQYNTLHVFPQTVSVPLRCCRRADWARPLP